MNQLIMNSTKCPNCQVENAGSNKIKKQKKNECSTCNSNIPQMIKSQIGQKKLDYVLDKMNQFLQNNQDINLIQQKQLDMYQSSEKDVSPRKQYQICLLHSKPADIICCIDGNLICANCALFGQHKGHSIRNCDQFLNVLTNYTEQALQVFDKLKQKQQILNQQIVIQYIDKCFQQQRNKEILKIKQEFDKLIQKIKKAQNTVITNLNNQINIRKQTLLRDICIKQLQSKKNEWYKEVQILGSITQQAYQYRNIAQALKYLDENVSQSFLLKRGEYLHLQYSSSEDVIKNKINNQTAKIMVVFNQNVYKAVDQYCSFSGVVDRIETTPTQKLTEQILSKGGKHEDDILIEEVSLRSDLQISGFSYKDLQNKNQMDGKNGHGISIKIPQMNIMESLRLSNGSSQRQTQRQTVKERSEKVLKSERNKMKSVVGFSSPMNRQILGSVENRKKRRLQVPQKYRQTFQDLKNDRSEVIDFGGAELGDQNILSLCQFIEKTTKVRNLKLVRNKISDEIIKQLLNACYCSKIISINLGQNYLTQKSLQMFQIFDLGQLKYITLSLNKINRRNVKDRLDDFAKRGITISI